MLKYIFVFIMTTEGKIIIFDTDDEFTRFCLNPNPTFTPFMIDGVKRYSYDFDFSPRYLDALKNGYKFKINEENSLIYKHKAVSRGFITKPVKNLVCN